MNIKLRSLLAAVVALSMAMPGIASADRRGGHGGHGYGGGGYKHGYSHGYKGGYPGRYYGYRGYPYGYYNYYNNDNDYDDLWLGLAVGGILGYAINGAQHPYDYYPRAQRQAYPVESPAISDDTCLQEREYQSTVVVGGKNVPAYGTACLQPDGSWRRGPAQAVTY
jgi:hypothetical protein